MSSSSASSISPFPLFMACLSFHLSRDRFLVIVPRNSANSQIAVMEQDFQDTLGKCIEMKEGDYGKLRLRDRAIGRLSSWHAFPSICPGTGSW